ncbi:hypothetical protein M2R47_02065 [Moraxella sp. Tifton1]|uniref:hypothetical protein n=1 Tax=Moraxella oculi TaxID=2940516 RepID=UPI002012E63E|nr:hypothetical protein [Moraxella sp. Tifton1]MCL1623040.1 hypothetical protein [Moraxella sp. Tifton1]
MKKLSILALTATIATAPAFAETTVYQTIPSTAPSVELSTQTTDLSFAFDDVENLQTKEMTTTEMQETEGAVAPLVAIGVIHGGRFIAQRWVTQRVAVQVARKSGDKFIQAHTRQQAKQIARAASKNNPNGVRKEFHNPKPSAPTQYHHFHPSKTNGNHIIYGKPKRY